jgi:hypothetical protein
MRKAEPDPVAKGPAEPAPATTLTHRLRRTFTVTGLKNGGNILELKEMLGYEFLYRIDILVRVFYLPRLKFRNPLRNLTFRACQDGGNGV